MERFIELHRATDKVIRNWKKWKEVARFRCSKERWRQQLQVSQVSHVLQVSQVSHYRVSTDLSREQSFFDLCLINSLFLNGLKSKQRLNIRFLISHKSPASESSDFMTQNRHNSLTHVLTCLLIHSLHWLVTLSHKECRRWADCRRFNVSISSTLAACLTAK